MVWVVLISLTYLLKYSSAETGPQSANTRIFWDQVTSSGIFPVEVNVPDTMVEMAQGVGQVYTNVQEWWQGARPTKVVTSAPEPPKKKKPTQKPNKKKKKPDDRPHKNVIINVMKTANMTLPNTVRSTLEPESKVTSQVTSSSEIIKKTSTSKGIVKVASKVHSSGHGSSHGSGHKTSKKKKKPHESHDKDMSHKLKKKKTKPYESQPVHVVHHYEDHSEPDEYQNDSGWYEESEEYGRPIRKKKKHKRMKRRKSMKKKGKEEQPGASKIPWPLSMDLNNVLYFFMGLFGVWPGGY